MHSINNFQIRPFSRVHEMQYNWNPVQLKGNMISAKWLLNDVYYIWYHRLRLQSSDQSRYIRIRIQIQGLPNPIYITPILDSNLSSSKAKIVSCCVVSYYYILVYKIVSVLHPSHMAISEQFQHSQHLSLRYGDYKTNICTISWLLTSLPPACTTSK